MSSVEVKQVNRTVIRWCQKIFIIENNTLGNDSSPNIYIAEINDDPEGFVQFAMAIRDALKGKRKRKKQVSTDETAGTIPENQAQITDEVPKRHRRTKAEIQEAQDQSVARIVNEGDDFKNLNIKTPTEDDDLYYISVTIDSTRAIAEGKTLREAIMKLIPDVESIPAEFTARERDVVESILKSS